MHDKIIHNPKLCLEPSGHSVTPFDPVTIYRLLGWSNWPLGVDIDHFENHWFRKSLNDETGKTLTLHRCRINKQCGTWQRSDVVTGVGAGTWRTRDKQFTWRHNTCSHCGLRLLQHNYRWQHIVQ